MIETVKTDADKKAGAKPLSDDLPAAVVMAPQLPAATAATYDPEADLMYTREIRGKIVQVVAANGIPSDPEMINVLLKTVKDVDAQALGIIRAKIEKDAGDLSAQNAQIVQAMLEEMRGIRPGQTVHQLANVVTAPPTLEDDPDATLVPGELDMGATHTTFEDFSRRVGGNVKLADSDVDDDG